MYKVGAYEGVDGFLQQVAQARGKLRKGGAVDIGAAARIVLQDWNDGRIPYFTLPPKRDTEVAGSAQLVGTWGADFDAEQSAALAGLASMEDGVAAGGCWLGAGWVVVGGNGQGSLASESCWAASVRDCNGRRRNRSRGNDSSWPCSLPTPPDRSALLAALLPCLPGVFAPASAGGVFFQTDTLGAANVDMDGMEQQAEAGSGGSGSEEDEAMSGSDGEEGSEEEGPSVNDAMDEAEAAPAAKRPRGGEAAAQNARLFAEAGQFNPHAARAERKRRKKGSLAPAAGEEAAEGAVAAEYDFQEDWDAAAAAGGNSFAQLGEEDA
jgi:hypothetical protein